MIDACTFGSMTIRGKRYTSDLLILPDGTVRDDWWRASGHRLTLADIQALIASRPALIVAGMGIYGQMKAAAGFEAGLADSGIELVAERTEKAARRFNELRRERDNVAGCFHLTC